MRPRQISVAVVSAAGLGTAASQPAVMRSCCLCFLSALLCSLQVTVSAVSAYGSQFPAASISRISLPISFEANQGQTDSRVNFLSRGSEYTLFLTSEEAVLQLRAHAKENDGAVLRMRLLGANQHADARGWNELAGKINYFIGRDPAKWHTNVPTYGKVGYNGVYPGVDLVYYGNQGQLEYDFIVSPWLIRTPFQFNSIARPPRLTLPATCCFKLKGARSASIGQWPINQYWTNNMWAKPSASLTAVLSCLEPTG